MINTKVGSTGVRTSNPGCDAFSKDNKQEDMELYINQTFEDEAVTGARPIAILRFNSI